MFNSTVDYLDVVHQNIETVYEPVADPYVNGYGKRKYHPSILVEIDDALTYIRLYRLGTWNDHVYFWKSDEDMKKDDPYSVRMIGYKKKLYRSRRRALRVALRTIKKTKVKISSTYEKEL